MKNFFLALFGAFVSSTLGRKLLLWHAFKHPHRHLRDLDGGLYMGRWRVIDEGTLASRLLELLTGYASCRVHHIMREDHDRDLHNHPFRYRTFVLDGFYAERLTDIDNYQRGDLLVAGDTGTGSPDKFHRITVVPPEGVWTLFFMSRNTGEWGFLADGKFVSSTRYLLRKGYTRQHVEEAQTL